VSAQIQNKQKKTLKTKSNPNLARVEAGKANAAAEARVVAQDSARNNLSHTIVSRLGKKKEEEKKERTNDAPRNAARGNCAAAGPKSARRRGAGDWLCTGSWGLPPGA
jgi:hypothetical protein